MRLGKIAGMLWSLLLMAWLSGCGDQGWVRASPNGKYTTLIREVKLSEEEGYLELLLYDLERNETTLIAQFSPDGRPKLPLEWVMNCQWTPDSRALSFVATESEETPSEDAPALSVQESENADEAEQPRRGLMLYELTSRKLLRLPIESPSAANWSRDGKYLIVYDEQSKVISVYRSGMWTRIGSVEVPSEYYDRVVSWEWAMLLSDAPLSALVLLGDTVSRNYWGDTTSVDEGARQGNLYLLRGERLTPFTTSNDVQAFWVDDAQSTVRWVRVKHGDYLAVFEHSLHGGAPRRLILIPHATHKSDAKAYSTYYRFSPGGDKLAWYTEEGLYVLDIARGAVRTLYATQPKSAQGGVVSELGTFGFYGFDWRDNDTLVIQRGDDLEIVSVRRLWQ